MTWDRFACFNEIQDSEKLTKPQKAVAIAIWGHADDHGDAYPAMHTIAAKSGYKERACRYAVRALEASNVLVAELRPREHKKNDSNMYRFAWGHGMPPLGAHSAGEQPIEQPTENQDRMSVEPEDRMSVRADARTANEQDLWELSDEQLAELPASDEPSRCQPVLWGFTDEQMPVVRSAVRQAAYKHLNVICRRQEENYLIRTLTRSGRRRIRHDFESYAAAAFQADPEKYRALLISQADNDGHVPDTGDELPEQLLSSMRDTYGYDTGWDLDAGLIDFRDYDEWEAA